MSLQPVVEALLVELEQVEVDLDPLLVVVAFVIVRQVADHTDKVDVVDRAGQAACKVASGLAAFVLVDTLEQDMENNPLEVDHLQQDIDQLVEFVDQGIERIVVQEGAGMADFELLEQDDDTALVEFDTVD